MNACRTIALIAILLLAAQPAWSDPNFDYMAQFGQQVLLQNQLRTNLDTIRPRDNRPMPSSPTTAPQAVTTFQPSTDVSARVLRQFADFVARQSGHPDRAPQILGELQTSDLLGAWRKAWEADGLRANDVIDANVSYWITNWIIANGSGDDTRTQTQGLRAQLAPVIAGNPAIAKLTEAERQELAEVWMLNGIVQVAAYSQARKANDAALIAKLGDAAEQKFRNEAHIDLRSVALTDAGFSKKP